MIQVGAICISVPIIDNDYSLSKKELFIMECNVRRMKFMIENEYSEDEWKKFKKIKWNI